MKLAIFALVLAHAAIVSLPAAERPNIVLILSDDLSYRDLSIKKDIECLNDLADDHPEIVARVRQIFAEAHEDSEWFRNPGDSDEFFAAKTAKARAEGSLQVPTPPNGMELSEKWKKTIAGSR